MVELLVRIRDSYVLIGNDSFDSKVSRRADVIVAMPDGWNWGVEELRNPDWRIIKLPNVSQSYGDSLTGMEISLDPIPPPTLQFRGFSFDVDNAHITGQFRQFVLDDTRASPTFTSALTEANLTSLQIKVQKAVWAQQKIKYQ